MRVSREPTFHCKRMNKTILPLRCVYFRWLMYRRNDNYYKNCIDCPEGAELEKEYAADFALCESCGAPCYSDSRTCANPKCKEKIAGSSKSPPPTQSIVTKLEIDDIYSYCEIESPKLTELQRQVSQVSDHAIVIDFSRWKVGLKSIQRQAKLHNRTVQQEIMACLRKVY